MGRNTRRKVRLTDIPEFARDAVRCAKEEEAVRAASPGAHERSFCKPPSRMKKVGGIRQALVYGNPSFYDSRDERGDLKGDMTF
jgi:hypothetical protein